MIRIATYENSKKSRLLLLAPLLMSFVAHIGFFYATDDLAKAARPSHGTSRVEFRTKVSVKPPPPKPRPKEIETHKPKPKIKPKVKLVKAHAPKSNTQKVPPPDAPPKEPKTAKPVFGVTADSVTDMGGGVSVRLGNTLAVEMENKYTKPEKVAPLRPAPTKQPPSSSKPKKSMKPVPVYKLTKAPSFKKKIKPKYPEQARQAGVEGTVQLEVLIDEKGKVCKVRVLKPLGHGLDRAAISAVSKSVFHPGIVSGKAVPVKIKIPYKFVLDS